MARRLLLTLLVLAALGLVPWTVYLAGILPDQHGTGQWRLAWVGFDSALLCCFGAAAWLGLRRGRAAVPLLAVTAALLCCDAWFDVVLDWTAPDRWTSVALAVLVELPLAALLLARARALLSADLLRRPWTAADIEDRCDPRHRSLVDALERLAPVGTGELARVLGRDERETRLALARISEARRGLDGRWRPVRLSLSEPGQDDLAPAERPLFRAHFDAKYRFELRLLHWAVRHREEFGGWGRGNRAVSHLTEAELAGFAAEYEELLARYSLRHRGPAAGTRPVAIRFYAFPEPEQPVELTVTR